MKILWQVAKEAKKYKELFIVSIISTLTLSIINLIAPLLMSKMTTLVAQGLTKDDLNQIKNLVISLIVLYLFRILFRYLSNYMAHQAAWNLVGELRMKVYRKLETLSLTFYRGQKSGDLVSRTISDTGTFELLYAHLIPESITNLVTVVGVMGILFYINFKLAVLTCLPIPLILLAGWIFAKKIRPYFRKTQKSLGILSAQLQDNYSGIQEIQIFNQQPLATSKVQTKVNVFTKFMLKALNLNAIFHPTVEFLTAIGSVIVIGYGGYLAYLNQISIGDIVAFLLYLTLFYTPITGLARLLEEMQQALAGAERILEVLDFPEIIIDNPQAISLKKAKGKLIFNKVNFSYTEGIKVLQDVSFIANPGEMVAIVGATGVGKTTIASLISRFYDPQDGFISLDDHDIKELKVNDLRKNIAVVLQDTFLFDGSIRENIALAKPQAKKSEIVRVAKMARIHDDIITMPQSYNTEVGERGAKLSGGQKQRIAIARALLYDSPILVLDEATASVDVQTEKAIQKAIAEITGKKTIIIIAHRLSTIRNADIILVMEEGKIIQHGTHNELINKRGLYQKMCKTQDAIVDRE